jgi:hypothetical protein
MPPITKASAAQRQNASDGRNKSTAIGENQRSLLRRRLRAAVSLQPEIKTLRALLLDLGGTEMVAPPRRDSDLLALIAAGFVMDDPVKIELMERNACHQNLARLWRRDRNGLVGIGTGYALSDDGLWRQHSWGVTQRRVIETTQVRAMYFGCLLQGQDADSFAAAND